MAHLHCVLCETEIQSVEFDLQKSISVSSKTSLVNLLQSIIDEEVFISNSEICKMCYCLLNELDNIKLRVKVIENQLKTYVSKYNRNKITQDLNYAPLKRSQVNELETTFAFNEIEPISDIDPLLDNILQPSVNVKNEAERDNTDKTVRESNDLIQCAQCLKTFKTATELKNHASSHSKDRPFICEICGQAYKRQQALRIHVGMHNGINPFTCIYCHKSFTQKGALVRHLPIHTGDLPYQCDLCGKRFVHHTSFNIHKLSHSGQKSYKCDLCGLSLMSGSHLKRHMKIHTGEKKYACVTCGKKFAEKYNLAVHEKLHMGISKKKKYQCQMCDNSYNRQIKLEEHLLMEHQKIHKQEVPSD